MHILSDFFKLPTYSEDETQRLFLFCAEFVNTKQILILHIRKREYFSCLTILLLPATPQVQTAFVMQQRQVRVFLNLPRLLLLDRFEHELTISFRIVLQVDLVYTFVIHQFVIPRKTQILSTVQILKTYRLVVLEMITFSHIVTLYRPQRLQILNLLVVMNRFKNSLLTSIVRLHTQKVLTFNV